jgi:outer membrane protein TolC
MEKIKRTNYKLPVKKIKTIGILMFYFVALAIFCYAENITTTAKDNAATKQLLTFDDCYRIATENNRDYKIAKLDKAIAEAQLAKGAAGFGPTISLMAGYEPIYRGVFEIPENALFPGSPAVGGQNYYSARVSLQQPVLTFGKTMFGFQIAKESYKIAEINFKKANEKLKLDVISAFYGALIARELAVVQKEALKANEEFLKVTRTKYANGQASNFDVLQAQVKYANSIPEAQKAADNAALAMQNLKNTLGLPMDMDIDISGNIEYKKFDMSYDDILKKFYENNDDRAIIESSVKIAENTRNLQYAMLLPNIALSLNYTYYSTEKDFKPEKEYWSSSWDGTIGLQWTFYDGFKNIAAIKESMANAEKASLNKENAENMLKIQIDQLYSSLEQSRQIIEAAGELIKMAEEGYRIAKDSYKNGLIQSLDLLNAETNLLQAKINYLNAMLNYTITAQKLKNFIE